MGFFENFKKTFDQGVNILQIITYLISFLLISFSIIRSIYTYIIEYIDPDMGHLIAFQHTRLDLARSITLSLSFLLGVEILKLFHIQTYKQLIIVISLVFTKLLIGYVLSREIIELDEK
jgi:uncharacterized membrane protein